MDQHEDFKEFLSKSNSNDILLMIDDWGRVWEFVLRNDLNTKTIYMIKNIFSVKTLMQDGCDAGNFCFINENGPKPSEQNTEEEEELKIEDLNISRSSEVNLNQFDINNSLCSEKEY